VSYYLSPRWSNEVADCSMPMTFDTYSNCSFGCLYCFSQYQRALGGSKEAYLSKDVKWVNPERVKKMFLDPDSSQFGPYVKARKVMQWGGLSDQFDGYERKYGITLELLRFFKEIDYPICFSTKATWWTQDERYMELFRGQKNWNVKFSVITYDEKKAREIEVGTPTPQERLDAMKRVADADAGGVTLRLRPFVIGVSDPSYKELIPSAARAGADALSTEFFCLELRSTVLRDKMPVFDNNCGFDVMAFYRKYSVGSGYLRLNRNVKRPYVDEMLRLCREHGMRFYVSDAHFKELCDNGSCCGLPAGWNYSRGQFCEALQIAKRNGTVRWSDIKKDVNALLGFDWGRAEGYNCNSSEKRAKFMGMSMADYLRYLWNNPQEGQSPYKMFEGVVVPNGKDEEGNLVYQFDASRSLPVVNNP
jgi:DNA repair photolyase